MMNLAEGTSQIRELQTKYYTWGIIGLPSFRMPSNTSGVATSVRGWDDLVKSDEMPLQPQIQIEPFEKWALDFMGPINPPSKQKVYILVCTDYVTKWVEAKALPKATEEAVANFLYEEFSSTWGSPRDRH
jgi:hypothetical protein